MGVSPVTPSSAAAVTSPELVFGGAQAASNGTTSGFSMEPGVPDATPRLSPQTPSTFNEQRAAPSAAPVVVGGDGSTQDAQETAAADDVGRDAANREAANREAEAAQREQQAQADKQQKDAARREQLSKVFEDTAARSSTEPSRTDTEDDARAKANAQREAQAMAREAMEVRQLEARQEEVHAHERAHAAVGGQYARSPNFEYEVGPDGKRYATGGEVSIDIAPVHGNARATINKMQQVYAAAMAPVNPSQADLMVAAEALRKINTAKESLVEERQAAMPDKEALAPLLGADNAIDELPAFEPVTPTLAGGSLDETGALVKDTKQDAVVEQISERVRASLAQTISITDDDTEQTQVGESSSTAAVSATADSTASSTDNNQDDSTDNPQSAKKAVDISLLGPPRAILAYLNAVEEESANEDDRRSSGVSLTV
nr:putative metalloprotease CJM1_0395 family protein [Shewanella khirikhana]